MDSIFHTKNNLCRGSKIKLPLLYRSSAIKCGKKVKLFLLRKKSGMLFLTQFFFQKLLPFLLGSSVDYLEEEYVDLDWNEKEDDVTSKATVTTPLPPALKASKAEALKSPPPPPKKSSRMKKRILDENHLEKEEGSGADQDLLGDDEDLLILEGSGTTEGYSDDSIIVDLGNIFLAKKKILSTIYIRPFLEIYLLHICM